MDKFRTSQKIPDGRNRLKIKVKNKKFGETVWRIEESETISEQKGLKSWH